MRKRAEVVKENEKWESCLFRQGFLSVRVCYDWREEESEVNVRECKGMNCGSLEVYDLLKGETEKRDGEHKAIETTMKMRLGVFYEETVFYPLTQVVMLKGIVDPSVSVIYGFKQESWTSGKARVKNCSISSANGWEGKLYGG